MQVFERTRAELIKSILYAASAGFIGWCLASVAALPAWAAIGAGVLLFGLAVAYLTVGENIRIELDTDGTLRFFRMGRLRHELPLSNYTLTLSTLRRTKNPLSMPDLRVRMTHRDTGRVVSIDCAPLGRKQFETFCNVLRETQSTAAQ